MEKPRLVEHPDIIEECQRFPDFYFEHVLGLEHVTTYQTDIANSVRDNQETAARSANGVGKSFLAGMVLSWWFDCFPDSGAFIAGPKFAQAMRTFRYMRSLRNFARFELSGDMGAQQLRQVGDRGDHWWVEPVTAKDPESFQGIHETRVLAIMEEASGVPDSIYQAAYGCVTGEDDRILHIGNPTQSTGLFANLFGARGRNVTTFTISAMDCPNVKLGRTVVPGLVGKAGVDRLINRFGKDSDTVRVRVHGLPPLGAGNGVFGYTDLERAKARGVQTHDEDTGVYIGAKVDPIIVGGLDVARMGEDKCELATIVDDVFTGMEEWEKTLTTNTVRRASAWMGRTGPASVLAVDVGAMGVAVFDQLAEEYPGRVIPVDFGGKQIGGKLRVNAGEYKKVARKLKQGETPWYYDRRTELWVEAAEWTRERGVWSPSLPDDVIEDLSADLLAVDYDVGSISSLKIERKDRTKDRLGHSPDMGDAYCLAVAALASREARSQDDGRYRYAAREVSEEYEITDRGNRRQVEESDSFEGIFPSSPGW